MARPRTMTDVQVKKARRMRAEGMTFAEIKEKLGLSITISALRNAIIGTTYAD